MIIEYVLLMTIAIMICAVCLIMIRSQRASGTLKIDHSNPEKDVYRFEIDDLSKLDNKSRIVLKIDHDAKLSQE